MNTINQIGGTHYNQEYQIWDFFCDTGISAMQGNTIKYLLRFDKKNGEEDLLKAKSYIEKLKDCNFNSIPLNDGYTKECLNKLLAQYKHLPVSIHQLIEEIVFIQPRACNNIYYLNPIIEKINSFIDFHKNGTRPFIDIINEINKTHCLEYFEIWYLLRGIPIHPFIIQAITCIYNHSTKGGVKDIEKAISYIDQYIEIDISREHFYTSHYTQKDFDKLADTLLNNANHLNHITESIIRFLLSKSLNKNDLETIKDALYVLITLLKK